MNRQARSRICVSTLRAGRRLCRCAAAALTLSGFTGSVNGAEPASPPGAGNDAGGPDPIVVREMADDDAEASDPIVVLNVGPSEPCAHRQSIESRVALRSRRIRFVSGEGANYVADARVARTSSGRYEATVEIAHPSGRRSRRSVSAQSCELAVDALALVLAITLDPSSISEPPPEVAPPRAQPPTHRPPKPRPEPRVTPATVVLDAGPVAQGLWGPAPGALPGFGWHVRIAAEPPKLWSPALSLAIEHFERGGFVATGGNAEFGVTGFSVDACPIAAWTGGFTLRPCASASAARIVAVGSNTYVPAEVARALWVLGGSALMALDLGARFSIIAVARVGTPLVRYAYAFDPLVPFHRVSPWTVGAAGGIAYRWLE